MNIREAKALVLLYEACTDQQLKRRVLRLVPKLEECLPDPPLLHRWLLSATSGAGEQLGSAIVVSHPDDLKVYQDDFAAKFDLASGVKVEARLLE